MNTKKYIPLYKRLIDDELIIGESISEISEVEKIIKWYKAMLKKKIIKKIPLSAYNKG